MSTLAPSQPQPTDPAHSLEPYSCLTDPTTLCKEVLRLENYEDIVSGGGLGPVLERKISYVKKKYRPNIPRYLWQRSEYAKDEGLLPRLFAEAVKRDNVERIEYEKVGVEEFKERFERKERPCIIKGVTEVDGWDVKKNWSWNAVTEDFAGVRMRIAQTNFGKIYGLSIRDYLKYLVYQKDDFPLYLFQTQFNELQGCADLLKRYKVPKYFTEDFFELVVNIIT